MLSIEGILASPPIEYLVDEMIPKGSVIVLAAPQGEGKSFWALDTALHLSRERSVVYLAAEGGPGFRQRLLAWQQYWGMPGGKFKLVLGELSLVDGDALEELLDMILDVEPELVVVDPLARVMGDGDENSARDMGRALTSVGRIQESGAAVLVLHHYGKSGGGVRGSTALPAGADVVMTLAKKESTLKLKCTKAKDSAAFADRTYELRVVELNSGESSCVVVPIGEASTAMPHLGLKQNDWKILKTMAQEPYRSDGIGRTALIERSGVPEGSMKRLLDSLKRCGYVEQPKSRGPYYLTPEGSALIDTNDQPA